eukprot:253832_1
MMRRAGLVSFRTMCPAVVVATTSGQRRWCTPAPKISPESTNDKQPEARATAASSTEPQEAFKINPAKVDASEAIKGTGGEPVGEQAGDDAYNTVYKPHDGQTEETGDAIMDGRKDGYDKFGIPEQGSVEWFSHKALLREGRAEQVKAIIHDEDTSAPPIMIKLAPGQPTKNMYNYTPDIPKHVTPL